MLSIARRVLLIFGLLTWLVSGIAAENVVTFTLRLALLGISSVSIIASVLKMRVGRTIREQFINPDPWMFMAYGVLIMLAAEVSRFVNTVFTAQKYSDSLATPMLFTASLAISLYGVVQMLRHRHGSKSRDFLTESVITACTFSMLIWAAIIQPAINSGHTDPAFAIEMIITSTVLTSATVSTIRLAVSFGMLTSSFSILAAAQLISLLGPLLAFFSLNPESNVGYGFFSMVYILSAALTAFAGTSPTMLLFEEPSGPSGARLSRSRIINIVASASLSAFLMWATISGLFKLERGVVATYAAAVNVLIVWHLISMVQSRASSTHWASHDKLTGLPNRALFHERVSQAIVHARKFHSAMAVMYLDLDRFKNVNDSMGHEAGDALLELVAKRIQSSVDPVDTVARLGGDEFAILMPEVEGDRVPRMVARRILKAFAPAFDIKARSIFTSPSIGIAMSDGSESLDSVLKQADTAMYRAKESGRNNFVVWTNEMNEESHQRLLLETHLHAAIAAEQLNLAYQPKVSMKTGRITGVEALLRWNHPKLGVISPDVFISLAEESGLIYQIGEWVLETACAQGAKWHSDGFSNLTIAVNLSSRQFQNHNVASTVARALRSTNMDPRLLELELTESLAMSGEASAIEAIEELRSMGVSTSIDDFGTGYSSLSYLSRFPVDKLKIDRSFIAQIDKSGGDAAIVVAIIAMAHGLSLKTIAEGVETAEQANFLASHNCDEMQGYLFSRPLPAEELEGLLMLEDVASGMGRMNTNPNMQTAQTRRNVRPQSPPVRRKVAPGALSAMSPEAHNQERRRQF